MVMRPPFDTLVQQSEAVRAFANRTAGRATAFTKCRQLDGAAGPFSRLHTRLLSFAYLAAGCLLAGVSELRFA